MMKKAFSPHKKYTLKSWEQMVKEGYQKGGGGALGVGGLYFVREMKNSQQEGRFPKVFFEGHPSFTLSKFYNRGTLTETNGEATWDITPEMCNEVYPLSEFLKDMENEGAIDGDT